MTVIRHRLRKTGRASKRPGFARFATPKDPALNLPVSGPIEVTWGELGHVLLAGDAQAQQLQIGFEALKGMESSQDRKTAADPTRPR